MPQKVWSCPECGGLNIFLEGFQCCMICMEEIDVADMIFDDSEEDGGEDCGY